VSPGATFERVYLGLKQKVLSGAFPPGAQLEPTLLSESLVASITPVRDALHRLVGERLVQTPRNDGFRIPILTEAGLRDLYRWNLRLLLLSLRGAQGATWDGPVLGADDCAGEEGEIAQTGRLFLRIAWLARSHELFATIAGLNDRLHAVRLRERELIGETARELVALETAFAAADTGELRTLLGSYHRRREKLVPLLLERIQPFV
jgi:hypothetical protein